LYNKEVVYFPIAGKIDFNDIGKRLAQINFLDSKIIAF